MNTDNFTGKADAYAAARPGYPDIAIEYIRSLVSRDAVYVITRVCSERMK